MRHLIVAIALAAVACGGRPACPEDPHAAAKQALAELETEVEALERDFAAIPPRPYDPAWVKEKLAHMVEVDQRVRKRLALPSERGFAPADAEYFEISVFFRLSRIDARHTRDLADLIATHGWFQRSAWGYEADQNAWLLAQHADLNPGFQRQVLDLLTTLHSTGETNPSNYAYLHDRVARGEDKPQRYGTQGKCQGKGVWNEFAVEDPARIDELRASVGLEPMSEYRALVAESCY